MRHARVRARLGPYLEGELEPEARRRVEAHLDACPACRVELAALRRTVSLLHALPPVEPPPGLAERALARVEAEPRGGLGRWLARHGAMVSAAVPLAAGVVVALAVLPRVEVTVRLGPGLGAPSPVVAESVAPVPAPPLRGPASSGPPVAHETRTVRETPLARRTVTAAVPTSPSARRSAAAPSTSPAQRTAVAAAPSTGSSSGVRPLPPRHVCLEGERTRAPECARWHAWMVGLAMRDPAAFFAEMDRLPSEQQERWLRDLSSFAADAGAGSLLASELRASGDPRAARVAPRFERVAVFPRR